MVMTLRPITPAIARSKYLLKHTVWMISLVFEYSAQYGGSLNSMKFQEKTEVNNFSIKSKISVFPLHLLYAKLQKSCNTQASSVVY